MFALHMVHGIYPKLFHPKEWEFFTGSLITGLQTDTVYSSGLPAWIDEERQTTVALLRVIIQDLLIIFLYSFFNHFTILNAFFVAKSPTTLLHIAVGRWWHLERILTFQHL